MIDSADRVPPEWPKISRQLDELIDLAPTIKKLRRDRWVAWVAGVGFVLVVVFGAAFVVWLLHDRAQDKQQRAENRARIEQSFVDDCHQANEDTMKVRKGFAVLKQVAVRSDNPRSVAAARELDAGLAEALPLRDCDAEAAKRAARVESG